MPIRRNSVYTDPGIAKAFDNLSTMFAPPGATDVLAYAKAKQTADETKRLSDFYNAAQDPNFDKTAFDRLGIGAGRFNPNQSYYSVDQGNATTLRTNQADNTRALAQTGLQEQGALARKFAEPVILSEGQTASLPQQTAAATGLPQFFQGTTKLNQGQVAIAPPELGGGTLAGAPKPLSETETKAAILGGLSPADQRSTVMSGVGTENIVGPDNIPMIVNRPDAAGQRPFVPDQSKPQLTNYKTQDGKSGTARFDSASGKWADTQTGVVLPEGSQTYSANLQGGKEETGLGTSAKNSVEGQLVDLATADDTAKQLRGIVTKNPGAQGIVGQIRGTVQDVMQSGSEIGQLLNVNMQKLQQDVAGGRVDPEVMKKFNGFDKNIPAVQMLETLLTAQVAKVLDPNGRISNDRYQQVAKALGAGGFTSNSQRTLATLDALDNIIASRRQLLGGVSPAAAALGAPAAGATPAAPAPAPAEMPLITNPDDALKLPPGTQFRTPDGRVKVRP